MDPPENLLDNINIKSDSIILDYGCGPGNFSVAVSKLFAGTCKIFALDMHPLAINDISKKIKKHKITNIETILSDCDTGLDSDSVDVILLHYVFNDLTNTNDVLQELHRILKPTGILSFLEFNTEEISPRLSKSAHSDGL